MAPGYKYTTISEAEYQADKVDGVVFTLFDNDPLLDRSVDPDAEIAGILRFLAQNFTEIVTHLVVCSHVRLKDRPGHGIYRDAKIKLPDERKHRNHFW